jgi:CRP-like cAMP-binding protein
VHIHGEDMSNLSGTPRRALPRSPRGNRLLAALPDEDYSRLAPLLLEVEMPLGWAVYESGVVMRYVYFPTTSIVSLLYVMKNGATAQIAVTGNEGLVGVSILMGGHSTPSRALVQSPGEAYRIGAAELMREFARCGALQHLGLRYTQALITQMAQTAACNRHHSIEQQLARWLLLTLDRLNAPEVDMTHELISNMLGIRREGVTLAVRKLRALGLIEYERGRIAVPDRSALEAHVCACYWVVRREYDRLFENPLGTFERRPPSPDD